MQRRALGPDRLTLERGTAPPIVQQVLGASGQPLDAATRGFFEPRFHYDFSRVRIHTDALAAESARAVDALAYTVGPNVVFDQGQYSPRSHNGQRLLAHELAHVVQQSGGGSAPLSISTPGDQFEREADRTALSLDERSPGPTIRRAGTGLMRQGEEHQAGEKKAGAEKDDGDVRELKDKVGRLVAKNFDGDYKKAFDHYDANHDGGVDLGEIRKLLDDADVGWKPLRGKWAARILERMDTNKDGKVDWKEFQDGIKG